jgi:O-antigen ligase
MPSQLETDSLDLSVMVESESEPVGRALTMGVLGLVLWAPIPFGSTEGWSQGFLQSWAFALLLPWTMRLRRAHPSEIRLDIPMWLLLAGALVGAAQVLAPPSFGSVDPYLTFRASIHLVALAAFFAVASNALAAAPHLLRTYAKTLIVWGGALALYAIVQHFAGQGQYALLRKFQLAQPFGTYVNRNHYAGFAVMLSPLALAFGIFKGRGEDWRAFYGLAAVLLVLSVMLTTSRGGVLAALCALTCFFAFVLRERRQTRQLALGAVVVIPAAIALGVAWMGVEPLVSRFQADEAETYQMQQVGRFALWRNSLNIIRERPILGSGLGAYEIAYTRWDTSNGRYRVEESHNDYLQCLTDAGVVGGALALIFIAWLFKTSLRRIQESDGARSPLNRFIRVGSLSGCVGMLVHSFFDFNLQIPANAVLFLFLVVLATVRLEDGANEVQSLQLAGGGRR